MKTLIAAFFALTFAIASLADLADEFYYSRNYILLEEFGYTLTTTSYQNGQLSSEQTGVSHHKVLDGIIPFEEITWTSLLETKNSVVSDLSAQALQVMPYQISLNPKGTLNIPLLSISTMTAMITDLNTYYVAISDIIGMQNLRNVGDVYHNPNTLKGEWANNVDTIVGQDCTNVTLSLIDLKQDVAVVRSAFLAPISECIFMLKPWMINPIKDGKPNNIQQVKKTGESYAVMWGHEEFTITTEIDRRSGIIKYAIMDNTLTLMMKVGCDVSLDNCQSEFPLVIQRDEKFKLNF